MKWDQGEKQIQDRWSKTYVTKDKSPTRPVARSGGPDHIPSVPQPSAPSPVKRFPRPASGAQNPAVTLGSQVSAHIASTTSRPPSPLKHSSSLHDHSEPSTSANAAAGILPNPNGSELAKVYGSILQPKETLASYHCALCSAPFPPDATIYPDPGSLSPSDLDLSAGINPRFLCRTCFTENGGSKGDCDSCSRPVLILKSEGGFVENGGRVWHKKCFSCEGCGKKIGDNPMVDLLGKPSCADCFESCLTRSAKDSPQRRGGTVEPDNRSNLGGIKRSDREREGSPALEELEQRLGIVRSRENTPAKEERLVSSSVGTKSPTPTTTRSPLSSRYTPRATGSVESSPIVERLAARARTDSFTPIGASSMMQGLEDGGPGSHMRRLRSPDLEASESDVESPLSSRRMSRYKSPEPQPSTSDGSPVPRRTYNRFRSPEPDVFGSSPVSRITGSPRYGSPVGSKQPTEEAIEEMKKRFLRQASPAPASGFDDMSPSNTTTPTRRSLSRPRVSATADRSLVEVRASPPQNRVGASRIPRPSTSPSARSSPSVSDLRSSIRRDQTGEPDYTLRRDRTGDAEVESLLGTDLPMDMGDLIDLKTDATENGQFSRSLSSGPMSKIPVSARASISPRSDRVRLNVSTSISDLSVYGGFEQSVPSTPDLAGDFSDTTSNSQSSAPSTPPSVSPPSSRQANNTLPTHKRLVAAHDTGDSGELRRTTDTLTTTPTPRSKTHSQTSSVPSPIPLSPDARCAKCNLPLFTKKHGGKFVTVPEEPSTTGVPPKTYHTSCFRCKVCDKLFEEREGGRAVFVRGEEGACHVEVRNLSACLIDLRGLMFFAQCMPPEKVKVRQTPKTFSKPSTPSITPLSISRTGNGATYATSPSSSRYERPPPTAPPTTTGFTFPRFGGSSSCPGCNKAVSPMERGVVPGPQSTRWHATCLLCGGKEAKGRRKEEGKPGCGKKLDSAAKTDSDGRVWCRECLVKPLAAPLCVPDTDTGCPLASPAHYNAEFTFSSPGPAHSLTHRRARNRSTIYRHDHNRAPVHRRRRLGRITHASAYGGRVESNEAALIESYETLRWAPAWAWPYLSQAQVRHRNAQHEERRRGQRHVFGETADRRERRIQRE